MDRKWMNKTLLALSIQMVFGVAYAAEEPQLGEYETTTEQAEVSDTAASTADTSAETNSAVVAANGAQAASSALQQQEGDATKEANLEEVFTSNERQYSLMRQGEISSYYDIDYTYHRDTQLDLEMAQGQLYQLRVQENASHALTNTFTAQYGLRDNLTLSASVPLVAKSDLLKDATAAGLGDISLGARWEPFPLKAGRLPLILFANLSTKTGDSPYEINPVKDLSTGKGYYSAGIGASTRKYIDPVVLFASASANYGFKESGLNQIRGSRIIEEFEPGISGGFAFGFAYSFNYDVSMTMSYQQSFNTGSEFTYHTGESYSPADQTSSTLAISLGVRVSPETIVNGTVGIGLTEDAPDVSLGLSFPLDILGFGKKIR
ncbi:MULTISPECIES: hypothetical protein [Acinetobacter]|jgi:hypothetical protein|uniref:Transporter n=1 Tax=Acinetobacter towneri TaxID=202956 RepID=A0ABX7TGN4_9GAMM|nr:MULTISPECIES: hypothetical protein [Acinetobacter]ENV68918.1 hypothetical protein F947_02133 [Acinetobacter towneri DSM 14962 = CIP 107472]MCO8054999.1 hypothetical protein [Acinetobacter towneri]QTD59039.1 hypothetical protein J4G44_12245 [Acinetobacter towneri]QTD62393.1 hypothetical protein J4G45_04220 [Acinetobacter towneri]WOE29404.1 hypothetical protein QSG83_04190 [Acinetobacter towneri]